MGEKDSTGPLSGEMTAALEKDQKGQEKWAEDKKELMKKLETPISKENEFKLRDSEFFRMGVAYGKMLDRYEEIKQKNKITYAGGVSKIEPLHVSTDFISDNPNLDEIEKWTSEVCGGNFTGGSQALEESIGNNELSKEDYTKIEGFNTSAKIFWNGWASFLHKFKK